MNNNFCTIFQFWKRFFTLMILACDVVSTVLLWNYAYFGEVSTFVESLVATILLQGIALVLFLIMDKYLDLWFHIEERKICGEEIGVALLKLICND